MASASTALRSISDALAPMAGPPLIAASQPLLGTARSLTAGDVKRQLLEHLTEPGLHKAVAGSLSALHLQSSALQAALVAGEVDGRALSHRSRSQMVEAVAAVRHKLWNMMYGAACMLRTCLVVAVDACADAVDGTASSSSSSKRDPPRPSGCPTLISPQGQRLLCALEDSCLLSVLCGLLQSVPGRYSPSEDVLMMQLTVDRLGSAMKSLLKLVPKELGAPRGPTGGSGELQAGVSQSAPPGEECGNGAQLPSARATALRAARLVLTTEVQQLQLAMLRLWVQQQQQGQSGQGVRALDHESGGSSAGGVVRANPVDSSEGQPHWLSLDPTAWGEGARDITKGAGPHDDRFLVQPALGTWQVAWRLWDAMPERDAVPPCVMAASSAGPDLPASSTGCSSSSSSSSGSSGGGGKSVAGSPRKDGERGTGAVSRGRRDDTVLERRNTGSEAGRDPAWPWLLSPAALVHELSRFLHAAGLAVERTSSYSVLYAMRGEVDIATEVLGYVLRWQIRGLRQAPEQETGACSLPQACLEAAGQALGVLTSEAVKLVRGQRQDQVEKGATGDEGMRDRGQADGGSTVGGSHSAAAAADAGSAASGGRRAGLRALREQFRAQIRQDQTQFDAQALGIMSESVRKAVEVVARLCLFLFGKPLDDSPEEEPSDTLPPDAPAAAAATALDEAPASADSTGSPAPSPSGAQPAYALPTIACSALLRAGMTRSVARVARLAGFGAADDVTGTLLLSLLSVSLHITCPVQQLLTAAVECGGGPAVPGSQLSAAASNLVCLMENMGKATLCAGSRLARCLHVLQQQQQQEASVRAASEAAELVGKWARLLTEQVFELLLALCGPSSWMSSTDQPPSYFLAHGGTGGSVAQQLSATAAFLRFRLSEADHAALRGAAAYCAAVLCRVAKCQLEAGEVLGTQPGAYPERSDVLSAACKVLVFPLCSWVPPRKLLFRAEPLRLLDVGWRLLVPDLQAAAQCSENARNVNIASAAHAGATMLGVLARLAACSEAGSLVAAWLMQPFQIDPRVVAGAGTVGKPAGKGKGKGKGRSKGPGKARKREVEVQSGGGAMGCRAVESRADAVALVADHVGVVYGACEWWAGWAARLLGAAREAAAGGGQGGAEAAGQGADGASASAAACCEAAAVLTEEWNERMQLVWKRTRGPAAQGQEAAAVGPGEEATVGAGARAEAGPEADGGWNREEAREAAGCSGAVEQPGQGQGQAREEAEAGVLWPRVCANEQCARFVGERDAELGLRRCGRCEARYCCRECQAAHWKAGHKRECGDAGSG